MRSVTEEQIADVHMGFRKGVGTRDQIFNPRLLIEKAKEASAPLYLAFLDYKKALLSKTYPVIMGYTEEDGNK